MNPTRCSSHVNCRSGTHCGVFFRVKLELQVSALPRLQTAPSLFFISQFEYSPLDTLHHHGSIRVQCQSRPCRLRQRQHPKVASRNPAPQAHIAPPPLYSSAIRPSRSPGKDPRGCLHEASWYIRKESENGDALHVSPPANRKP